MSQFGLIEHLDRQLTSSRRLLGIVLAQGDAIKVQDVEAVLARLADVQAEMVKRAQIERERDVLLQHASVALGVPVAEVSLESILVLVPVDEAEHARELSAELRGLLAEVARVHAQNRVLIRQELAFLDPLMRVLTGVPQAGYSPFGEGSVPQPNNLVDMRA
jgi:hypothetical protein